MILNAFAIAFRQLLRNRVRTLLTSLGILIGVAAVISMLSIGAGATAAVDEDLSSFGQNLLFVRPGNARGPGRSSVARPFTEADVTAIATQVSHVAAAAPSASTGAVAVFGDAQWTTQVTGATEAFLVALRWEIATGRRFEEGEALSGADVCLLGNTVVTELFGGQPPLDQELRLGELTCRVVGTLAPKGKTTFGTDQDDFVLVPLRTFQRRLQGNRDVSFVFVSVEDGADSSVVAGEIEALMRQRRHVREGAEDDFAVSDMKEVATMLEEISRVLTGLLAAIAAVSLLVGGIGIMNIMLVSVTERTREIGIRLAIGARARDVLVQFLVESVVLAALGGVLGTGLGVLLSVVASRLLDIPLVVDPFVVAGAVGFSGLLGVLFGYFPARRAARMHPIDALRAE